MAEQPEPLLELLELTQTAPGIFHAPAPRPWLRRVFGGQLLAQALWAASRTLAGAECYALHAQFLTGAEPGQPIEYEVSSLREGRSLAVCGIVARQGGVTRLVMHASFEREPSAGREFQIPMPSAPPPDSFPSEDARVAEMLRRSPPEAHEHIVRRYAFEWITVDENDPVTGAPHQGAIRTWMRGRETLTSDVNLHRAALAYASDMTIADPCMNAIHADFGPRYQIASLDHAMWFHRPLRADDWLLFSCESPSVSAGRGMNRGVIYDRAGRLVASVAQELLVRERDRTSQG